MKQRVQVENGADKEKDDIRPVKPKSSNSNNSGNVIESNRITIAFAATAPEHSIATPTRREGTEIPD